MLPCPPALLAALPSPAASFQAVWLFFARGGPFMIPLGLCAVIGVMAILYKALSLSQKWIW
jgi:hypothetical protein